MLRRNILIFMLLFLFGVNMAYSDEVKIYFKNWHYLWRYALTETDVRENAHIYIHITDDGEIDRLKNLLETAILDIQKDENIDLKFVYMVIDIIENNKIKKTYLLNNFNFIRKGSNRIYKTPEIFLNIYTLFNFSNK